MNRLERRVRKLINPYSTAFAGWWCFSGRYTWVARHTPGVKAATGTRPPFRPTRPPRKRVGLNAVHASPEVMAKRRGALDAMFAEDPPDGPESS